MARAESLHQASDSISRQSERRPEMWLAPSSNAAEDFAASETTLRVHAKAGRSKNLFPSEAGTFLPTPCRAVKRKSRRALSRRRTCAGCRTLENPSPEAAQSWSRPARRHARMRFEKTRATPLETPLRGRVARGGLSQCEWTSATSSCCHLSFQG